VLSSDDQAALFALARAAIHAHLTHGPQPPLPDRPALAEPRGVFVTLRTRDGALRGCIGHSVAQLPLAEAVRLLAVSAAVRDRRFPPLTLSELAEVRLELSVLSPLAPADPAKVEVGIHGLLVRQGARAGLLLPQVAASRGWTRERFLAETCVKAGLAPDSWQQGDAVVEWFTAACYDERSIG
jgi:AmmeMemoRadiSam system protein A